MIWSDSLPEIFPGESEGITRKSQSLPGSESGL